MRCWMAFVVLLLAGCAPEFAMTGDARVTPLIGDEMLTARDGTQLPLRRWEAEGKPRAVIVALHGMSDYSNAFDMPGKVWAKQGITTLAYDQRGFGRNPAPGVWAGAETMRADLNDAVAAARTHYPGVPVYALGESMGGAVVLTALGSANPPSVDGAILVAPAVWSRGDMPVLYRTALFLGAHLLPGMVLSNSAAGRVVKITPSDNIPMLIALGKDPLFQKRTSTGTLYGLVNLMDEARTAPDAIKAAPPILFLYGANDQIIPAKPTEAVVAGLGPKAMVRKYDHGWHMLLRDLEGEQVAKDVGDWVLAQKP
ncbi:MAG: alpha/beta hydrolase [Alphaproteobacteria bacterium]|nr:alpha/beta hydrolase [Alphaproteobacteria bacterium]